MHTQQRRQQTKQRHSVIIMVVEVYTNLHATPIGLIAPVRVYVALSCFSLLNKNINKFGGIFLFNQFWPTNKYLAKLSKCHETWNKQIQIFLQIVTPILPLTLKNILWWTLYNHEILYGRKLVRISCIIQHSFQSTRNLLKTFLKHWNFS